MRGPLRFTPRSDLQHPALIIGWGSDAGKLGGGVTNFLVKKLKGQLFYEIEPTEYFPLGSVTIEDDLVQFPESKFYVCPEKDLVILNSAQPTFELYQFFQEILDIAEHYCNVKEVYSIEGMASMEVHTIPRQLLGSFSSSETKNTLGSYDIDGDLNFETSSGQKPMLNSFLLWATRKRNIAGVDLAVPIPFYFTSLDDFKAQKRTLDFFSRRFNLSLDLSELDAEVKLQNLHLCEVRTIYPEINDYFMRLESNLHLSEEENMKLVKTVEEYLKEKRN